jgi:hypothetical protein
MINTAGAFILVIIYTTFNFSGSGVAMQEFNNEESCRAAIVQLKLIGSVRGFCIAKDVIE